MSKPTNETKAESKSREPETQLKAESKSREPETDPKAESKSREPENEPKAESKSREPGNETKATAEMQAADSNKMPSIFQLIVGSKQMYQRKPQQDLVNSSSLKTIIFETSDAFSRRCHRPWYWREIYPDYGASS